MNTYDADSLRIRGLDDIASMYGVGRHAASVPMGDVTLTRQTSTLDTHQPIRRVTRSGRSIYGAHPSVGSDYWTREPTKLERRKARSRIAALCRREPTTEQVVRDVRLVSRNENGGGPFTVEMEGR